MYTANPTPCPRGCICSGSSTGSEAGNELYRSKKPTAKPELTLGPFTVLEALTSLILLWSTRVTVLVCTPRITLRAPEKKNLRPKNSLLKMRKKSVHQKVSTKSHGFHITFKSSFVWLSKRKASCKEAAASLKKPPDAYWELLNMWRPFKLSQHQARMYSWQHKSAETDCLKNMLI